MASKLTQMLFADGEGLAFADLNDISNKLRQHAVAAALYSSGRGGGGEYEATAINGTLWLHAIGDSCAPAASATNLKIDVLGGVLMQSSSFTNPINLGSGTDLASVLSYAAYLGELSTVHDAGDAGGDRWDLVSIQLAQAAGDSESRDFKDAITGALTTTSTTKRTNVTIDKVVTKGTPGAGTIPATPAGHVRLYAVKVPTSHTGVLDDDDIRDFRLPTGRFSMDVYARDQLARGAVGSNTWSTGNGAFGYVNGGGAIDEIYFVPHAPLGHAARLISVQMLIGESTLATIQLMRFNAAGSGDDATATLLDDVSGTFATAAAAGNLYWVSSLINTNPAITNPASCPLWINGHFGGYAKRVENLAGANVFDRLGLYFKSGAAGNRVSMVRFNFAGGL